MRIVYNREKNSTIMGKYNCTTTVRGETDEEIGGSKKIYCGTG